VWHKRENVLFAKVKSVLKGEAFRIFKTSKKKKKVMTPLKAVPHQEFQKYFQQGQHRWAVCIAAQGEYFEGDPS
jgi:hypothetical protein